MSRSVHAPRSSLVSRKLPVFFHEQERIRWFKEHRPQILKGVGIFLVIVVSCLLLVAYQRQQSLHALEQLRLGIAEFQAGKLEEAISFLKKAKGLFGLGDRAQVANFYLAETYIRQGQLDRAKGLLTPHASSMENSYLSQIILLTQGRNAEKQNDQATARKLYEDAAALTDGPLGADALLGLARIAESAGDTAAVSAAREKLLATYPNSPFADIIRQKLDQ